MRGLNVYLFEFVFLTILITHSQGKIKINLQCANEGVQNVNDFNYRIRITKKLFVAK